MQRELARLRRRPMSVGTELGDEGESVQGRSSPESGLSGLMGNALFLFVFGAQWLRVANDPSKEDRAPLFAVMATGSALALAALVKLKPKKKKKG